MFNENQKYLGKLVNEELTEMNKEYTSDSVRMIIEAQTTRVCDECQTVGGHSNNCGKCE